MIKRFFWLLLTSSLIAIKVNAQKTSLPVNDEQKRQLLGMNVQQYNSFSKGIQGYNKRFITIFRDKTIPNEKKREAFEKLQFERKAHIEKFLTPDQRKRLYEFEKNNPETQRSRSAKLRKEHEEQLKKRGLKITTDKNK